MKTNKKEIQAALRRIEAAGRIAILSHDRPDADAVGSMLGLGLMLEALGKEVHLINADGVPSSLGFLPGAGKVRCPGDFSAAGVEVDLVIALDSAGRDRISEKVWAILPGERPVINVDHHSSNTGYGTLNLVDTASPATGEIIYDLAVAAGWKISREAAENLYAAISTDTGSFRYPSTTAKTYRVAAGLIEAGLEVGRINQLLYETYPLRRVECLRELLNGLKLSCSQRCASVLLTGKMKDELGLKPGDTEGIIDIIRAVDTVEVAVFFEEMSGGITRISARSKKVDISAVCAQFGGGGHHLAAGARIQGPVEEAERRFLKAVASVLDS